MVNFENKTSASFGAKIIHRLQVLVVLSLLGAFSFVDANLWDNLWSNNQADRVVFPPQFELSLSWNATGGNAKNSHTNTNYVQGHIKIDQITNRMVVDTNFSTLSLAPQELVSYILDFNDKALYLKQKDSCKVYDLIPPK